MIGAAVLDALLAAGASAEMIVEAVKAATLEAEARKAERRTKDAERQRRARSARRARNGSSAVTVTPRDAADVPPNEYKSNPPAPQSSGEDPTPDGISFEQKVVATWNDSAAPAGALGSRGLNPRRRQSLKTRVGEHGEAAVLEAIAHVAASRFHCGANNRGWRASLGWLLTSAENFQKMLELAPSGPPVLRRMSVNERADAAERSAALFDRMGRTDDAAELRRTAASLRANQSSEGET